jgi:hypothetical protein
MTLWDAATATTTPELAAGVIVRKYVPDIAQFVQSMRQQYSLGSVDIMSQHRTWPGLKVVYQNQSGVERVAIIAQPITSGSFSPGSCVVTTQANQIFYAADPTKWQEFDPAPAGWGVSYQDISAPIFDVLHQKYFVTLDGAALEGADFNLFFSSPPGASWNEELLIPDPALNSYGGPNQYFVTTGVTTLSAGGPPWSMDGKNWFLDSYPPGENDDGPSVVGGLEYPAPVWVDPHTGRSLYVQAKASTLCDINNNVIANVAGPFNTAATSGLLTAGNGLLVGVFQGAALDSLNYVLGVSRDNINWSTLNQIGNIPNITTAGPSDVYTNFGSAALTFVPGWNLFVFVGSTATPISYTEWYVPLGYDSGNGGPLPQRTVTRLAVDPVQIYTSPDGVNWTKQFQAGYTNGTAPPQAINGQPPSTSSTYWYTTTSNNRPEWRDFNDFVSAPTPQFFVVDGVTDPNPLPDGWFSALGPPITVTGSFPGTFTTTAPPGSVQINDTGPFLFLPITNTDPIVYIWTAVLLGVFYQLTVGGQIISSSMGPTGIAAGYPAHTYPIIAPHA